MGVVILVLLAPSLLGLRAFHAADILERYAPWSEAPPDGVHTTNPLVSDTVDGLMPSKSLFRERLHDGDAPLWDGFIMGGRPLASLPNESLLSPLNLPYWALPLWYAPGIVKSLELAMAVGLMFLFLRRVGLGELSSVFGGLVYAFSGFQVVWTNWPQSHIGALIPGVFWGIEVVLQERRARSMIPLAVITATMWLEGFPAVTVYALAFGGAYAIVRLTSLGAMRGAVRRGWAALAGIALGLGVAAFQLAPFGLWVRGIDLAAREQNPGWTLARRTLATLAVPNAFGNPVDHNYYGPADYLIYGPVNYVENQAFIGIAALALVGIAAVHGRRILDARRTWFLWGGVGLCGVLIYWGGPLLRLVQTVPFIGSNHIGRLRSVMLFLLAGLAAIGFEALVRHHPAEPGRRRRLVIVPFGVIVFVVGAGLMQAGTMAADAGQGDYLRRQLLVAGAMALIVGGVLVVAHIRSSTLALWVLPVVMAFEAIAFAGPWWPQIPVDQFYPSTSTHRFLQEHGGGDRIAVTGQTMLPSTTTVYRLRSVTGHSFPTKAWRDALLAIDPGAFRLSATYSSFAHTSAVGASPFLDRLAARYLVTDPRVGVLGVRSPVADPAGAMTLAVGDVVEIEWVTGTRAVVLAFPTGHDPGAVADEIRIELVGPDGQAVSGSRRLTTPVRAGSIDLAVPAPDGWELEGVRLVYRGDTPITLAVTGDGSPVLGRVLDDTDQLRVVYAADTVIYERLGALPRIRWASRAIVVDDPVLRIALLSDRLAPGTVVLSAPGPEGGGDAEVRVLEDEGGDSIAVEVTADGPGYLVIADSLQEDWLFRVDGRPVEPLEADHVGVAIPITAGTHVVEAVVNPRGWGIGLLISTLSVLVLAGVAWRGRPRREP